MLLIESELLLNQCNLNYHRPTNDIFINGDAKQLKQVFLNLIKNAMDAIKEGKRSKEGMISIEIKNLQDHYEIDIADNGIGIEKEKQSQLFTPFYTTKKSGTGVGLAVCKKIITEHNGTITLESEREIGTKFKIQLPKHNLGTGSLTHF